MSDEGDLGPRGGGGGDAGSREEPERPAPSPAGWPGWTPSNPPRGWPTWSPPTWSPEELEPGRAPPGGAGGAGGAAAPGGQSAAEPPGAQPARAEPPRAGAPAGAGAPSGAGAPGAGAPTAAGAPGAGAPEPLPDDVALEESFLTVWTEPRATIRRLVARDPGYWVLPLAMVGGITEVLSSQSRGQGAGISLGATLLASFISGPILGLFTLYVGGWLIRRTGHWWLHGEAEPAQVRTALGWGSLPHVLSLPLWLLATAAFGVELYTASPGEMMSQSWVYVFFILAVGVLQIWGVVIASAGVAEVQRYRSAWKGFGNILLAVVLILLALIALVLLVGIVGALLGGLLR